MERRQGYPFSFRCRRSGNCCAVPGGVVRVSEEEIRRLAGHLGIEPRAFRSRYLRADGERLVDGPGNRCVFLDDGAAAACRVYPARPEQCRQWPFWPGLRDNPEMLARAMRICPGIVPGDGGGGDPAGDGR